MAEHKSKLGPIPDKNWENEPTPGAPLDESYSDKFMTGFDKKTREIRAAALRRLGRDPQGSRGQ